MPAFAHLTLPTVDVEATASFLVRTFGFTRAEAPANSPVPTEWIDIGGGQQIHVVYVEGFVVSPFEGEFGRHIALRCPASAFEGIRGRLVEDGIEVTAPVRPSQVVRFFTREPVNGYVFEVIATD